MGGIGSSAELSARAAQPLSILGGMIGPVVHDFRNILSVIDSGLRLAESNVSDPEKVLAYISGARHGIACGVRLTSQLLNVSKLGQVHICAVDLNSLLKTTEPFLKYGAGPSVSVILECSPTIPKCLVDPSQFTAAILNLIVNARDAVPSVGGEVRICTACIKPTPATSDPGLGAAYVRVRVQDNGSGMPDDVARRVFEPFFTTKGDKGTGLGVPQVGAFMRQVGGHVTVSSEQGRGTKVDLFFPGIEADTPLANANCAGIPGERSVIDPDDAVGLLSRKTESMAASHPPILS
jgi:signal transduction histidine kinase